MQYNLKKQNAGRRVDQWVSWQVFQEKCLMIMEQARLQPKQAAACMKQRLRLSRQCVRRQFYICMSISSNFMWMFLIFQSRFWYQSNFSFLLPILSFFILERSKRLMRQPIWEQISLLERPQRSALISISLLRSPRSSSSELFFRYSSLSIVIFFRERRYFLGTGSEMGSDQMMRSPLSSYLGEMMLLYFILPQELPLPIQFTNLRFYSSKVSSYSSLAAFWTKNSLHLRSRNCGYSQWFISSSLICSFLMIHTNPLSLASFPFLREILQQSFYATIILRSSYSSCAIAYQREAMLALVLWILVQLASRRVRFWRRSSLALSVRMLVMDLWEIRKESSLVISSLSTLSSSFSRFFSSKQLWYSVLASCRCFILLLMLSSICIFFSSSSLFSNLELFSTRMYLFIRLNSLACVTSMMPKLLQISPLQSAPSLNCLGSISVVLISICDNFCSTPVFGIIEVSSNFSSLLNFSHSSKSGTCSGTLF